MLLFVCCLFVLSAIVFVVVCFFLVLLFVCCLFVLSAIIIMTTAHLFTGNTSLINKSNKFYFQVKM